MDISILKLLKFWFICSISGIITSSCQTELDYNVQGYEQKIIVEGRVESDNYANVYLSLNVPLTRQVDSVSIADYVIRYAKVTVSDGVNTEVLTSKWDKKHFPPYLYRSTSLKGQTGKSYTLKVEYSGYEINSITTIPSAFEISGLNFIPLPDNDSLRVVEVSMILPPGDKTSYRCFTKKSYDDRFIETPALLNSNLNLSGMQSIKLSPDPLTTDSSFAQHQYFLKGDSVELKIFRMDSASTQFYKRLTLISSISSSVTTGEIISLPGNISKPGFGIWSGQSVRHYKFKIE